MRIDMSVSRSNFPRSAARALSLAAALCAAAPLALAQPAAPAQQQRGQGQADPIAERVFPPELIMVHAGKINLTDEQRQRVVAEVERLQQQAQGIGPRGERARAGMVAALDAEPADEASVLSGLEQVLTVERDIKRLHIATLVRIRNLLTPAQRARLNELR